MKLIISTSTIQPLSDFDGRVSWAASCDEEVICDLDRFMKENSPVSNVQQTAEINSAAADEDEDDDEDEVDEVDEDDDATACFCFFPTRRFEATLESASSSSSSVT